MKTSLRRSAASAFLAFSLISQSWAGAAKQKPTIIPLFDPKSPSAADWKDNWGGTSSGADAKVQGKKLVFTGTLSNQSYGCVYRSMTVDLDKTPYMEVDVDSCSHHWFIIFKDSQFPTGYARVQGDTDQTGIVQYDLRMILGMTGRKTFSEVQFGISTEGATAGNEGQTLVINSLRFVSPTEGGAALELFGPNNKRFSGWKNVHDDRSPAGVDILPGPDNVTVKGNRANQSYGMMWKAINLDLSKYSVLKFDVEKCSHHWFMIMTHPKLKQGFARVQPDTNQTGVLYYDLADISGLTGINDFRLQIGVSTAEQKPSNLGEALVFKEMTFLTPAQVPSTAKLMKKKDLRFTQAVQALAAKAYKKLTDPALLALKAADASAAWPAALARGPADYLGALTAEMAKLVESLNAAPAPSAVEPAFSETASELVVQNDFYRIAFNKQNGGIVSLQRAGEKAPLIVGSVDGALWKIDCTDRSIVDSGKAKKGGPLGFLYAWDAARKTLTFDYQNSQVPSTMKVTFRFDAADTIDAAAEIKNDSLRTFQSLSLPQGLLFNTSTLDKVVLPRNIGVAFLPGFFQPQKQWLDPYPPAFADYAWIGTGLGNLTLYMVQNAGSFQPASLEIGGMDNATQGYYTHRIPVWMKKGAQWKSPRLRLSVGRGPLQTIKDYARDNGIDKTPSLKDKLKPDVYQKLINSVMIKADQTANVDINTLSQAMDAMPTPAIFHLSAFWAGGFDKNYPDYLPPDPDYGTLDDLKKLVKKAQTRGMLVMPYTNPTWWNDGPTTRRLKPADIGVKEMDQSLIIEKYNGNQGWVVLPGHPKVIERNAQTVKEFTETVPMDFLFHDQIGARRWIYQYNSTQPVAYTQGLIDEAARGSAKIPLMTEGGFDRIMPYEIGFCGMTSMSYPEFKEYDGLFGAGNWEIYPISSFIAHDKVIFYQHNLSNDVLAESPAKIAWNIAHGFGLNEARSYVRQNVEKIWTAAADLFQKNVLSRVVGQEMKGYTRLGQAVWSRFGDVDIFANPTPAPLALGEETLAPQGFLVRATGSDLTAGYLTKLNGLPLEESHLLLIKTSGSEITVTQPEARTTFLALARPAAWKSAASIKAYRLEKGKETETPLAVEPDRLVFLYKADGEPEGYKVKYLGDAPAGLVAELRPAQETVVYPEPVRVEVSVANTGAKDLSNVKVTLGVWRISADNGLPALPEAPNPRDKKSAVTAPAVGTTWTLASLKSGSSDIRRFTADLPPSAYLGRFAWMRATLEYTENGKNVTRIIDGKVDLAGR